VCCVCCVVVVIVVVYNIILHSDHSTDIVSKRKKKNFKLIKNFLRVGAWCGIKVEGIMCMCGGVYVCVSKYKWGTHQNQKITKKYFLESVT